MKNEIKKELTIKKNEIEKAKKEIETLGIKQWNENHVACFLEKNGIREETRNFFKETDGYGLSLLQEKHLEQMGITNISTRLKIFDLINKKIESETRIESNNSSSVKLAVLTNVEIGTKIGSGEFGEVFSGKFKGTEVALKSLHNKNITKESLADFLNEGHALQKVPHPNIVQIYGYFESSGNCYFVMELMETNLLKYLDIKRTFDELSEFSIQTLLPIVHLHSIQMLHRDIAARNYLVKNGQIKLSDFGLAKNMEQETYYAVNKQKFAYRWCAPEVVLKKKI